MRQSQRCTTDIPVSRCPVSLFHPYVGCLPDVPAKMFMTREMGDHMISPKLTTGVFSHAGRSDTLRSSDLEDLNRVSDFNALYVRYVLVGRGFDFARFDH